MARTWTQRADKVLALLEKLPAVQEGSPEKEFRRAVGTLCQQLKDAEDSGGHFIPESLMD